MSAMTPSGIPDATDATRGLMSAADKGKLDLYPANPDDLGGGVVEAVTDGNGLTLTTGTLAMGAAGAAASGAVTTGAQTFAGAKTLSGAVLNGITTIAEAVTSLVRAAGAALVLRSTAGALSTDVAVRVGTEVSDAGTHASAKLLQVGTGIGGTFVERLYATKTRLLGYGLDLQPSSGSWIGHFSFTGGIGYVVTVGGALVVGNGLSVGSALYANSSTGRIDQAGTDSSGTAGAATINKPIGKSAIASGASSVVIANNLVAAGDNVHVTWHGDHGQTRSWVTTAAGSFTVHLNAAASANTAFCWVVSKRI